MCRRFQFSLRTLFILTHRTLYAVKTRVAGAPFAAASAAVPP